jgi:hypothetical protein
MGSLGEVLWEKCEQGVAQQSEISEGGGFAGPGGVFTPDGVATPVVADLDSAPVATDEFLPLRRGAVGWFLAGEVVAGFSGSLAGLFDGDLTAYDDDTACEREVGGGGVEGEGGESADLYPPVPGGGVDKKGVPDRALKA